MSIIRYRLFISLYLFILLVALWDGSLYLKMKGKNSNQQSITRHLGLGYLLFNAIMISSNTLLNCIL